MVTDPESRHGARRIDAPASDEYWAIGLLSSVLPPGVEGVEATRDDLVASLWPGEEDLVARVVPKRRREVCAGRACARRALEGLSVAAVSLPADGDRVPRWPDQVRGSITHTEGYAAAAVGWAHSLHGLGLDAERISRVRADVTSLIAKPSEIEWLDQHPEGVRDRGRALLFSAKEAAYKCQFPATRQRFDFLDASCAVAADHVLRSRGRFSVRFDHLHERSPPPPLDGLFAFSGDLVVTVAVWPAPHGATPDLDTSGDRRCRGE